MPEPQKFPKAVKLQNLPAGRQVGSEAGKFPQKLAKRHLSHNC
jgi:hypothetical protein